jgi:hypothetical protein
VNGTNVSDSLIGQMIHLGPNTQFVGTPNKGGKEVLMNFELFLGSNKEYFSGRALKAPLILNMN